MKFADTFRRSSRNLKSAKLRTLLTALAISVGGFTLALTLAASTGARQYTDRLISANFDQDTLFVVKDAALFGGEDSAKPREYSEDLGQAFGSVLKQFSEEDVRLIESQPNVEKVIRNYSLPLQFLTREGQKRYTGAINVYNPFQKPEIIAGSVGDSLGKKELLLPDDYLPLLGFASADDAIGKTVELQVRRLSGETLRQEYKVVAVTTQSSLSISFAETGPYLSQETTKHLSDFVNTGTVSEGRVPTLLVKTDGNVSPDEMKQHITALGFEARTADDLQGLINQVIDILQIIILVFGFITLIASFFGVVNTQYISVLERTREIGLMKALGMSGKSVSALFVVEATWIGFIGSALGCAAAIMTGTLLNPWISEQINFGNEKLLIFDPLQIAALIIFLMFVTTMAGLLPATKAAKLDPIEALRTE